MRQWGWADHEGPLANRKGVLPVSEQQAKQIVELPPRCPRSERLTLLLLTVILLGLGAHGVRLGLSSHGDSRAIVEKSIPAILHGSYLPSRSLGNPLYEAICALLYWATGSLTAVNCYSLALTIAALFTFAGMLAPTLSSTRQSIVLAGFSLNPMVLINSSALIEWMQMTLLLVVLLAVARAWLDDRRHSHLFFYGLTSALLVLTRPDSVVACLAVLLALLWQTRLAGRHVFELIVSNIVAALVTAVIFLAINHGRDFLHGYQASTDPVLRRLGVASLSTINVFGPLGVAVITVLACNLARSALSGDRNAITWWGRLFLVAAPLFFARFVMMPDKLEYILPLVPITLLAVAHERVSLPWLAAFASSLIVTSAVCVSLFKRTGGINQITFAVNLNRGALAQDWEVTRFNRVMTSQEFLDRLADLVYVGEPAPRPQLHAVIGAVGIISDENDLIIGEDQLYRLDNARFPFSREERKAYRRVYVCDGSISGFLPGWRVWQQPRTLPGIDPNTNQLTTHCREERS